MGQGRGEGAVGVSQPPWSHGPALLRPGALAASLIPPQLLPPSSSLSLPSLLLLLLYSLLLPKEPRPLPPPPSATSAFQDERARSTTRVVVLRTLALLRKQGSPGPAGTTNKMAEGAQNPAPRTPGVLVHLAGGSPLPSIEKERERGLQTRWRSPPPRSPSQALTRPPIHNPPRV